MHIEDLTMTDERKNELKKLDDKLAMRIIIAFGELGVTNSEAYYLLESTSAVLHEYATNAEMNCNRGMANEPYKFKKVQYGQSDR